jgi:hypothetical protein
VKHLAAAAAGIFSLICGPAVRAQIGFDVTSIVRPGDAAPAGQELMIAVSPSLNDRGQVAYQGDGALFLSSDGVQTLVAGYGDPSPGGGAFIRASAPSLNAQGQIAFRGEVASPSRPGIFLFTDAGLSQVVADGDPAPGGGALSSPNFPALNAAGQVSFIAGPATGRGLYLFSGGVITLLARAGDPAPGGGTFIFVSGHSLNGSGQVAFTADLSAGNSGVFLASKGTVTKIARSGEAAPAGGTFIAMETAPSIDDNGRIAFEAFVSSPGRSGMFQFSQGAITQVVRTGDPAPGGGVFTFVDSPALNAAGQLAFRGGLSTGGTGVFLLADSGLTIVVAPGDGSPEGDQFAFGLDPSLNAAGQVAFAAQQINLLGGVYLFAGGSVSRVAGQGNATGRDPVFYEAAPETANGNGNVIFEALLFPGGKGLFDESFNVVVRAGDAAPGGGIFADLFQPSMNDSYQVAFVGLLSSGKPGVFLSSGGKISKIAVLGDPAPGGGAYLDFDSPSINNAGQVVFAADVSLSGRSGIFLYSDGKIAAVVQEDDPAPGGGRFDFVDLASLNDDGRVAFFGEVTGGGGQSGIFLWSGGDLSVIARHRDPAPGGGTFVLSTAQSIFAPSLNAAGQVAFAAGLSTGSTGVFLFADGNLSQIARPGDLAPGGGTFTFADSASLNNSGQVTFPAGLSSGGIGAFVFSEGSLSAAARPGDSAPGGGSFTFADFPQLNALGQLAFYGGLSTGGNGAFLATPR